MRYALEYLRKLELYRHISLPDVYSIKRNYTKEKLENGIYLLICQITQHCLGAIQK